MLVRRAPGWQGALRIHLTRLSTEGLGPQHGKVCRAHQMLNVALHPSQRTKFSITPDRDQRQDHSLMKAHIIKYLHNTSMVMYKARIS